MKSEYEFRWKWLTVDVDFLYRYISVKRIIHLDNILLSSICFTSWAWSHSSKKGIVAIGASTNGCRARAQKGNRKFAHHAKVPTGISRESIKLRNSLDLSKSLAERKGIEPLTGCTPGAVVLQTTPLPLWHLSVKGCERGERVQTFAPRPQFKNQSQNFRRWRCLAYKNWHIPHPLLLAAIIHVFYLALLLETVQHRIDRRQWILVLVKRTDLFKFVHDFGSAHGHGMRIYHAQNIFRYAAIQCIFQTLRGVLSPICNFSRFFTKDRQSIHGLAERENSRGSQFLHFQNSFKLLHRRVESLAVVLVSHCSNLLSMNYGITLAWS
jgi:hypothetical protein